jgi:site-specific recombinase XerD
MDLPAAASPPPALLAALPAERVETFLASVGALLELWVQRHASRHTQRAYRADILHFARFLGLSWPRDSHRLLRAAVADVQAYRDALVAQAAAPKTIQRRLASLAGFYRFLGLCAAEWRLPVQIPNPAHAQFIARGPAEAVRATRALTAEAARQLLRLPEGDSPRAVRDRAILALYLYTGMRLATGCRLRVEDFFAGPPEATLRLREKGGRIREIGLHQAAARAVAAYLECAGAASGPLFRPLAADGGFAARPISEAGMYALLRSYLRRLPGAAPGQFTPHSLRATTATLLLGRGLDMAQVQELLGHRHITTTQLYDKRRRGAAESASHALSL